MALNKKMVLATPQGVPLINLHKENKVMGKTWIIAAGQSSTSGAQLFAVVPKLTSLRIDIAIWRLEGKRRVSVQYTVRGEPTGRNLTIARVLPGGAAEQPIAFVQHDFGVRDVVAGAGEYYVRVLPGEDTAFCAALSAIAGQRTRDTAYYLL